MGFSYNKNKDKHNSDSQWTSYSDLFMGLSTVFLLLYVTTSLRTGTNGLQQQIEKERLTQEVEDLRNQLKVYNTLKKETVEQGLSKEEESTYANLLNRLDLLQEEAKTEKDKLRQAALENENKEKALNHYQQMVRNIVNANMLAKARIHKRDEIIEEKNVELTEKSNEIVGLEKSVEEKKRLILQGEQKISQANAQLQKNMQELKWAFRNQKLTKKAYERKMAELQDDNEKRVASLKVQNETVSKQLVSVNQELENVTGKLSNVQGQLSKEQMHNAKLVADLQESEKKYGDQIGKLKSDFEGQRAADRAAFDAQMAKARLSAAERAKREGEFRAGADRKQRELNEKLAALGDKMKATEGQLAKAKAEIEARKQVANEIRKGFAQAGIKAEVDSETGEVFIDFGEHYFDTGRADLKAPMIETLKKAFPVYASALLSNPKVANKVSAVEIIGFASPTFKNKIVDPSSLSPEVRQAVDYNMDLSYARARSIFQYLFDTNRMQYKYQKELLPMVKVTGRSFLAESKRKPSGDQDFCAVNDCKKAQRVIIRFSMDK